MIYNGYCFLYTENNTERSWRLSFQQTQWTDYTMNTVALITPLLELPLRILFLSWIELVSNVYFNIYKKFMVSRKESPGHCSDSIGKTRAKIKNNIRMCKSDGTVKGEHRYLMRSQNDCPRKVSVLNSHAMQPLLREPQKFLNVIKILRRLIHICIQIFLDF